MPAEDRPTQAPTKPTADTKNVLSPGIFLCPRTRDLRAAIRIRAHHAGPSISTASCGRLQHTKLACKLYRASEVFCWSQHRGCEGPRPPCQCNHGVNHATSEPPPFPSIAPVEERAEKGGVCHFIRFTGDHRTDIPNQMSTSHSLIAAPPPVGFSRSCCETVACAGTG